MYKILKDTPNIDRLAMAAEYYRLDENLNCEVTLYEILDSDPCYRGAISLLGALYQKMNRPGMSEILYRYGVALWPDFPPMWTGLGTAISNPCRGEEAVKILSHAIALSPDSSEPKINLSTVYVAMGEYEKGLDLAKQALEMVPDSVAANDSLAMASLGLEDFKTGWDKIQVSLGEKWRKEIVYGDEERWNGEKGKTVIIYGEQGLGDEIFYGSVINDAIKDCKRVIIDCDSRLEGLFKRSFPDAFVYGTRDKTAPWLKSHKWDYRCAVADLSRFYRNDKKDFPGTSYLKADETRASQWRKTFNGVNIGVAFRGGGKFTQRELREVPLEAFRPLLDLGNLVSLEYSEFDYEDFPIEVYDWAMAAEDYDNAAALVSQLDYVVTTATTVVHLAGALGIPCFVLMPKFSSWRFSNDMPWHNSVRLIKCDGDWDKGMDEVVKLISLRNAA